MKLSSRRYGVVALLVFSSICSRVNAGVRSVPVMTAFTVKLDQPVLAKTAADGAPFTATLKQPVEVDGQTIIPAGASAGGVMSKESPNTAHMELNSVFVNGRSYRITTEPVTIGQKASLPAGATLTFRLMLSLNLPK
jgi:hypothetical protein